MKSAEQILDLYYLDARCMLVELAAILDRHDRAKIANAESNGSGHHSTESMDPRLAQLQQSMELLAKPNFNANRSEQLLNLFSDLD